MPHIDLATYHDVGEDATIHSRLEILYPIACLTSNNLTNRFYATIIIITLYACVQMAIRPDEARITLVCFSNNS